MDLNLIKHIGQSCLVSRLPREVFNRIFQLGIQRRPSTRRGTRAGRLHRLWHGLPPAPAAAGCVRQSAHTSSPAGPLSSAWLSASYSHSPLPTTPIPATTPLSLHTPPSSVPDSPLSLLRAGDDSIFCPASPLQTEDDFSLLNEDLSFSVRSSGSADDSCSHSPPVAPELQFATAVESSSPLSSAGATSSFDDGLPFPYLPVDQHSVDSDHWVLDLSSAAPSQPAKKLTSLTFGLWNARSAVNKTVGISEMIVDKDLDALCICETWLKEAGDEPAIGEMTPPGYSFRHSPRSSGLRGGGVAFIFRQQLKLRQCKQISYNTFDYLDLCLTAGKQTVRFVVVYRPSPSESNKLKVSEFFDEFPQFLSDITLHATNALLVGDFNFHMDNKQNSDAVRFTKLYEPLGFSQLVSESTQQSGHTLDLVLSRSAQLARSVTVEDIHLSDHYLVQIVSDFSRPRVPRITVKRRNLKSIDRDKFRDDLSNSLLILSPPDDVNSLVNLYNDVLSELLNKHAPEVEKRIPNRQNAPWMNDDILKARQARRRAERRKRRSGLTVDVEIYRKARDLVTHKIKAAKACFFQEKLESASNPKETFSLVNRLLNKCDCSDKMPNMDSQTAAYAFSDFFQDKINKIRAGFSANTTSTDELNQQIPTETQFAPLSTFKPLTLDQIIRIVKNAKPTTAVVDPIPTRFVLEFLDILGPVIRKVVNLSMASGVVPDPLKRAAVRPLLKKPSLDPETLGNYRPVSNLPYLSKILERAVAEQLHCHLDSNKLQVKFQSAYRHFHSTETALVRILNDLLSMIDSGRNALLVLLDLSSAFDTIDHDLLLHRLHNDICLDQIVLSWFSSYLSGRVQHVYVGSSHSDAAPLLCGVPQGSVLGPLLFSLYMRNLATHIEKYAINYHFFADDTQLYSSISAEPEDAVKEIKNIENCCLEIKKWMDQSKLKLNEQKTEVLLCGPPARRENVPVNALSVGDACIPLSDVVKTLGVYVDADLSMENQVSHIVKTSFYHLRSISRIRPYITKSAANAIAVSLILSRLDYCNSTLVGLPQSRLKRVQALQNAAARVVSKRRKYDHLTPILNELHWLPVQKRVHHKLLSLVNKCRNGVAPGYLSELLEEYVPSRTLRSASQSLLRVPGPREVRTKTYGQRCFKFLGPSLHNALPVGLRESGSESFRARLKTHLFLNPV